MVVYNNKTILGEQLSATMVGYATVADSITAPNIKREQLKKLFVRCEESYFTKH